MPLLVDLRVVKFRCLALKIEVGWHPQCLAISLMDIPASSWCFQSVHRFVTTECDRFLGIRNFPRVGFSSLGMSQGVETPITRFASPLAANSARFLAIWEVSVLTICSKSLILSSHIFTRWMVAAKIISCGAEIMDTPLSTIRQRFQTPPACNLGVIRTPT